MLEDTHADHKRNIKSSGMLLLALQITHGDGPPAIVKPEPVQRRIQPKRRPREKIVVRKVPTERHHLTVAEKKAFSKIPVIQELVASFFDLGRVHIIAHRRDNLVVIPRQIAMYLAKELTPHSLPEIGRRFGGRDHSTILYGVRKIARLIKTDPNIAEAVRTLREQFDGCANPPCVSADQAPGAAASDSAPALAGGAGETQEHQADGIGVAA